MTGSRVHRHERSIEGGERLFSLRTPAQCLWEEQTLAAGVLIELIECGKRIQRRPRHGHLMRAGLHLLSDHDTEHKHHGGYHGSAREQVEDLPTIQIYFDLFLEKLALTRRHDAFFRLFAPQRKISVPE
jgi:hypothetical protein